MFELQSRIEITNYILNKFISLSKIVNIESSILGLLVFMIHWFFIAIPLITILVGTINWKFWISICIWISIYIFHFYFNGCILTKIERRLFNDREKWYGPWTPVTGLISLLKGNPTKELMNNVFFCWGILLSIFTLIRIFYYFFKVIKFNYMIKN